MEKINGKWIHDGREYEVVDGPCSDCPFKPDKDYCSLEQSCPIELRKIFKLKEPKMKKEELNFKVLTPTEGRAAFILRALDEIGITRVRRIPYDVIKAVRVMKGEVVVWTKPFDSLNGFDASLAPEVTLEQALELLKRVEPAAPEFDIRLRDEVLVSDVDSDIWELCEFARVHTDCFMMIGYGYGQKMVKYAGNEHLHGTANAPDGWWECCEGKPVWRSK